jgi:hypothetical protein
VNAGAALVVEVDPAIRVVVEAVFAGVELGLVQRLGAAWVVGVDEAVAVVL